MTSRPLVSIVIPAYNNEKFIGETLTSVLAQDYPNLEIVIADHSSSDRTSEVIARFAEDPRMRVLSPTRAGGGALANWTRVTEAARGEYVKLVCGDDLLAPTAVSRQAAVLDAHPGVVLVASRRALVDANSKTIVKARGLQGVRGLMPGVSAIRATVRAGTNVFGEPACVMMRRAALVDAGGWDNANPYLIDQATYANVLHLGDFFALPDVLARFRISASQWSFRLVNQQAEQAMGFHDAEHARFPEQITAADVRLGNFNARKTANLRRVTYMVLGKKRMGIA